MRVRSADFSGFTLMGRHTFRRCGLFGCLLISFSVLATPALGQLGPLIYSQSPNRLFGFSADTAFVDDFGQTTGQLVADRFVLSQSNSIGQIRWFGMYGGQSG